MASKGIAIFIIPIIFSFVYGGAVLGTALSGQMDAVQTHSGGAIDILDLQSQYSSGEKTSVQISVDDSAYDCGDLYITIYDVSGGQKKAVKQGAFFDQCYGESGTLPINDKFSETIDAGQYLLEVQLFDKNGDKFLSASQRFSVQ
ncbi:hypothetical protein [Candidatus Nitrosotenuis aquarius]|uniref:hypothetical protein n=1 Tax=Candidatus Nitrosotenuis aquarius TaxID=1846278 RepID=UPI000C1ECDA3|nr:hypothetical protein [Candidatus Nitrosotenuis aquarius]